MFSSSRASQTLTPEYSNSCWQCDHTLVDVMLRGMDGTLLGRPWLTIVIDLYSRCIMGFHLGVNDPNSEALVLALRHAILPKPYGSEYNLYMEWKTYGVPEHLYVDGNSGINLNHLNVIAAQLGFLIDEYTHPTNAGIVERCFHNFQMELFSALPGYTQPRFLESVQTALMENCLTLPELERLLVRYIVDNHNQQILPQIGNQSRLQRWEAGLISPPRIIQEQNFII